MIRPGRMVVALLTLCVHPLFGGVVLDGSLGMSGALPGPDYMIQASFGKQVGTNLFHSFSQFDLISSESATFSGPSNIQNILARVTSGSASSIDGLVRSDIAGANLFLLNPAGVIFGAHAQIDVSGSFAASTANYLKLADGGRFNTSLGGQDVLTSAPVTAFGFLNAALAPVSITGSALTVAPAKCFSVVAGDISIEGGNITGEGSRVNLVSVKSAGEAQLDATTLNSTIDVTQFAAFGDVNLSNASIIDTSGPSGGAVVARGGNIALDGSEISSSTLGLVRGGTIDLESSESVHLIDSSIVTDAVGSGKGGDVLVNAPTITIERGAITTMAEIGDGGNITLTADSLVFQGLLFQPEFGPPIPELAGAGTISAGTGNAGSLTATANTMAFQLGGLSSLVEASGNAGNVTVSAHTLVVSSSDISSTSAGQTSGSGGNISVQADSLTINNSTLSTSIGGAGNGGSLTLIADILSMEGDTVSTDAAGLTTGNAGSTTIQARNLTINNSTFSTGSGGSGSGGNIILAADSIVMYLDFVSTSSGGSGNAGNVIIQASDLNVSNVAFESNSGGSSKGGDVMLTADSIFIGVGGFNSDSSGSGDGGNIIVTAGDLQIIGGTLTSNAFNSGSSNSGGNLILTADSILIKGGSLLAQTFSRGSGGSITLNASSISLEEQTFISASTSGIGAGGSVTLNGDSILINGLSLVSADAFGSGKGGNVEITGKTLLVDGRGIDSPFAPVLATVSVQADAESTGNAGLIMINVGILQLGAGGSLSSNTLGRGSGGSIAVFADSILIDGAGSTYFTGVSADAAAGSGKGGEIMLNANSLIMQNGSGISATSLTSADAGSVSLSLGTLNMDSGSSISSANTGTGSAGSLLIDTTGSVDLKGASILSTSSSLGDAGSIELSASGIIKIRQGSSITASAGANGGNISISAPDLVYLTESSITATAGNSGGGGGGTGGNVTIDDPQIIFFRNALIRADATFGQGGNINLVSNFFFNADSLISATGSTNGTVNITAPELDLGAILITLPGSLLSAETQLRERCTAQLRGDFSSFITLGRGGTEPAPDELQITF